MTDSVPSSRYNDLFGTLVFIITFIALTAWVLLMLVFLPMLWPLFMVMGIFMTIAMISLLTALLIADLIFL